VKPSGWQERLAIRSRRPEEGQGRHGSATEQRRAGRGRHAAGYGQPRAHHGGRVRPAGSDADGRPTQHLRDTSVEREDSELLDLLMLAICGSNVEAFMIRPLQDRRAEPRFPEWDCAARSPPAAGTPWPPRPNGVGSAASPAPDPRPPRRRSSPVRPQRMPGPRNPPSSKLTRTTPSRDQTPSNAWVALTSAIGSFPRGMWDFTG
jgi:hypothetical protein